MTERKDLLVAIWECTDIEDRWARSLCDEQEREHNDAIDAWHDTHPDAEMLASRSGVDPWAPERPHEVQQPQVFGAQWADPAMSDHKGEGK